MANTEIEDKIPEIEKLDENSLKIRNKTVNKSLKGIVRDSLQIINEIQRKSVAGGIEEGDRISKDIMNLKSELLDIYNDIINIPVKERDVFIISDYEYFLNGGRMEKSKNIIVDDNIHMQFEFKFTKDHLQATCLVTCLKQFDNNVEFNVDYTLFDQPLTDNTKKLTKNYSLKTTNEIQSIEKKHPIKLDAFQLFSKDDFIPPYMINDKFFLEIYPNIETFTKL